MRIALWFTIISLSTSGLLAQLDTLNTVAGYRAGENRTPTGFINNTVLGVKSGFNIGSGDHNTYVGHRTGYRDTVSTSTIADYDGNSFFGSFAGEYNEGGRSAIFGHNAGSENKGSFNSFFGNSCGNGNVGASNAFYGSYSGSGNVGEWNSFYGYKSGYHLNNTEPSGEYNSYFGNKAGEDQLGSRNSFFGAYIVNNNNSGTGNDNSYFGYNAGSKYQGYSNSIFGSNAGMNNEGNSNAYFGSVSGEKSLGSANTFIGYAAGAQMSKGSGNVIIGYKAGPESDESKYIDLDNQLFIDNTPTDKPLIYGDFRSDILVINGSFEATGGVSNNSSIHVKDNFEAIDIDQILDQVAELDIQEWSYKKSDVRHIGPVAQDFFSKFSLGGDETKISTIDADGIALAAIQALKNENDKLKFENVQLKKRMERIEESIRLLKK